jgi:hypothetical protein
MHWYCAYWCPTCIVLCFSFVLFRLVNPKLSASLDCHCWIALWYSLTFSDRRLTFLPNCIWTPTFSAKHNNLASVVWHTSLMLFHFNTVTTNFNGKGEIYPYRSLGSLLFPLSLYCPSSGHCIICPSLIYGLQLPFDIFLLLHMYDLLYL